MSPAKSSYDYLGKPMYRFVFCNECIQDEKANIAWCNKFLEDKKGRLTEVAEKNINEIIKLSNERIEFLIIETEEL